VQVDFRKCGERGRLSITTFLYTCQSSNSEAFDWHRNHRGIWLRGTIPSTMPQRVLLLSTPFKSQVRGVMMRCVLCASKVIMRFSFGGDLGFPLGSGRPVELNPKFGFFFPPRWFSECPLPHRRRPIPEGREPPMARGPPRPGPPAPDLPSPPRFHRTLGARRAGAGAAGRPD